jgi:hypothetical protein
MVVYLEIAMPQGGAPAEMRRTSFRLCTSITDVSFDGPFASDVP